MVVSADRAAAGTGSRAGSNASGAGVVGARAAAEKVAARHAVTVDLFGRRVELPSADQLAYFAGLGVLAVVEIIEWPVAVALTVGHALAHSHHGKALRELGDALDEA